MITIISFALIIALCAISVTEILMQPGMLFWGYWQTLEWINKNYQFGWLIAKPFGYCSVCFAGQCAFWTYFYLFDYEIFYHITFTLLTILFTKKLLPFI
jgi:hypothetical protein